MPDADRLEEIRAREAAAWPGPWAWRGNTSQHELYLHSPHQVMTVMDFTRYGMQDAQPRFVVDGLMRKAEEFVEYTVHTYPGAERWRPPYRHDVCAIKHPDAEFIAAAREDVPWLLRAVAERDATIDELRTQLKTAERQNRDLDRSLDETLRQRDFMQGMADKLAYAIAPVEDIGEHSSGNCPWESALDLVTSAAEVDRLRKENADLAEQLAERTRQLNGLLDAIGFDEKAVPA